MGEPVETMIYVGERGTVEVLSFGWVEAECAEKGQRIYQVADLAELLLEFRAAGGCVNPREPNPQLVLARTTVRALEHKDATAANPERAIFDMRLNVTAADRRRVFDLVNEFTEHARNLAPVGVVVRYTQLRPGHPLSSFVPTMVPKRRRR